MYFLSNVMRSGKTHHMVKFDSHLRPY